MHNGGKGSKPRPFSVDQKTFDSNWDNIFKNRPSDYQDVLSTEDSMLDALVDLEEFEKKYK